MAPSLRGNRAMTEPIVIGGLKEKRAELSGIIADLEKRINQHRTDPDHPSVFLLSFVEGAPRRVLEGARRWSTLDLQRGWYRTDRDSISAELKQRLPHQRKTQRGKLALLV